MKEAKEEFRQWLVKHTRGCDIQSDGWPCGTCVIDLLVRLGVKENGNHNVEISRENEMWRGILQIRGEEGA